MSNLSFPRSDASARQSTVSISLSTSSPTFSLSSSSSFSLMLTIKQHSPSRRSPITLSTHSTPLDNSRKAPVDTLSLGYFTPLECTSNPDRKPLSLGLYRVNEQHRDPPSDLREREWEQFIVLQPPAATAEAENANGPEVSISHPLSLERILQSADAAPEDIKPRVGERWKVGLTGKEGVAAWWWTWGDVYNSEGLGGKKLSAWRKGWDGLNMEAEKPEGDDWVVGEDPETLWLEVKEREVEFEIVE